MNRRSFTTKALAGIAAVPLFGVGMLARKKYGRVNIREHTRLATRLRCFVDGVDVTNACFEADDVQGYALCYKTDERGRFVFDRNRGEVVVERLTGDVKLTRRAWTSSSRKAV